MIYLIAATIILLPGIMILFGLVWRSHAPKSINFIYGYRTSRSMASPEAWEFAHKTIAKIWLPLGIILEAISAIVIFLFRNAGDDALGIMSIVCIVVQLAVMMIPVFFVEKALKDKFSDKQDDE